MFPLGQILTYPTSFQFDGPESVIFFCLRGGLIDLGQLLLCLRGVPGLILLISITILTDSSRMIALSEIIIVTCFEFLPFLR